MLFWADYYLRWWRLPIEERACRKKDLGGGDYYLRNSGLPPSPYRIDHFSCASFFAILPESFNAKQVVGSLHLTLSREQ